ncbi:MAG TPA: hypothetical protein VF260_10115 [Bacilli bacterium]
MSFTKAANQEINTVLKGEKTVDQALASLEIVGRQAVDTARINLSAQP